MKIIKITLILNILFISFCCTQKKTFNDKKQVVVTGKVHHYNGENAKLYFIYSQPGVLGSRELIDIDGEGNFEYKIDGYIPLDAVLLEQNTFANINFIYHPGDSIHIEFEAKEKKIPLLKTVKFSEDGNKTNNQIINFQILREENNLGYGAINQAESYKKNVTDFILEMNSVKEKQLKMYKTFVEEQSPSDEAKNWAKLFALETYYYFLDNYANGKENLPDNYSDYNNEILPITLDNLICWSVIEGRITSVVYLDLFPNFSKQNTDLNLISYLTDKTLKSDSLFVNFVRENYTDNLQRQLIFSGLYKNLFGMTSLESYQRNQDVLKTELNTPFISKALYESFEKTIDYLKSPKERTALVLKKMKDSPIEETFNKILEDNKGKVIYIDCWGTNCVPCIKEMPDSKLLMSKFKEQDVQFVYLCLSGDEKNWNKLLSKFQLDGGQQYLLDNKQDQSLRDIMQFNGIPYHILIDKNGSIIESGNQLGPSMKSTEVKIAELASES
ncbi:TlpA disulfide reductase family protein [Flavivirga aquimarina]|uniref:TlpA disulfide reductase family protein n=1 Tax=Flavivirga aquimarina TaxID=2027862 RepID=A0ABT8W5L0_9FLAO|nr:TlpA disulfide reductase family protein [Flavivirga aquimarina]MDO5968398.1 TlpA disulfide reductase family protein [Flavivirga aquimarina]